MIFEKFFAEGFSDVLFEVGDVFGENADGFMSSRDGIHAETFLNNPGIRSFQVRINGYDRYIPNSDRFLNGDDLSENVYRTSRSQNGNSHHMRFGHVNQSIRPIIMNPIPNRFQLAHQVAVTCYIQITGNAPQNWNLVQGEAIQ